MTTLARTADYAFFLLAINSTHGVMLCFGWPTPEGSCCAPEHSSPGDSVIVLEFFQVSCPDLVGTLWLKAPFK